MKLQITFEITSEVLKKNPQFLADLDEMIRRAAGDEPIKSNNGNDAQQSEKQTPTPKPFMLNNENARICGIPIGGELLVTGKEVAEYVNTTEGYIRFLVMKKRIPFQKYGRKVRFRMSEIDAWNKDKRVGIEKKPESQKAKAAREAAESRDPKK